jgi:HK97 family phage prohead protease
MANPLKKGVAHLKQYMTLTNQKAMGLFMTKQLMMLCEAQMAIESQDASKEPTGKISARVTTWGAREGADGRKFFYKPEGFMQWAKEFADQGRPLPMYVNHESQTMPVGEWTEFEFDDDGMTATGRLYMNTTTGSDLYQIMSESPNMFGGVSVGAYAEQYQWVKEDGEPMTVGSDDPYEDGYFQITKGGLREVSVVIHPNNPQAEVKSLEYFREDGTADLKVLEKALRDVGLSKKDAVAAASVFKQVIEQRDVVEPTAETAPDQRDADVEATKDDLLKLLEQRELVKILTQRIKG